MPAITHKAPIQLPVLQGRGAKAGGSEFKGKERGGEGREKRRKRGGRRRRKRRGQQEKKRKTLDKFHLTVFIQGKKKKKKD